MQKQTPLCPDTDRSLAVSSTTGITQIAPSSWSTGPDGLQLDTTGSIGRNYCAPTRTIGRKITYRHNRMGNSNMCGRHGIYLNLNYVLYIYSKLTRITLPSKHFCCALHVILFLTYLIQSSRAENIYQNIETNIVGIMYQKHVIM